MLMGSSDLLWDGVGERHLGGLKAHRHGYSLREPVAVPLVARRETHLPARVGEGCIQHLLGKRGRGPPHCGMHNEDEHPTAPGQGAQAAHAGASPNRPHTSLLPPTRCRWLSPHPPSCPHTPQPLSVPCQGGRSGLPPHLISLDPLGVVTGCRRRYASSNSFPIVSPET